ncbi:tetratricopeptide repeat protein [Kribbella sp. NPDC051770]|uniref:ATP-binding protein n=1 Tax=Kribbella sp. NPDC051770 TaxID=3155413 RepID=UPI00341E2ADF
MDNSPPLSAPPPTVRAVERGCIPRTTGRGRRWTEVATELLGELLREFRLSAGLTQGALAEKAGLSEQAVSLLERGTRRRPRISTLQALAGALGLDADAATLLTDAARGSRDPAVTPVRPPSSDTAPPPRQLPPTLADFTGRPAEVEALVSALTDDVTVGTVRTVAVTGMGGVGKTSLAVHAAHLTADLYPDGHLYLDLRGYGPGDPVRPIEALAQLLRSLGVDGQSIPDGVEESAALYRSRLAGLRILVLLDSATGAAQVRSLLPGAPGAAVIVTSRRSLTTLPGFRQIRLSPLSEADSVALLGRIAGESRVAAEAPSAKAIARLTGRLPLAVRLIGARLAARPGWPVEHVKNQLQDGRRRLDELGSGHTGVRSNIAASVEFLAGSDQLVERQAAEALDFLGLPDGTELVTTTAASLLGESEQHAEEMLERLVDLNLLESTAPGHYRMHDLIQAYARESSGRRLTEPTRIEALARVLTYYTELAWRCQQFTHPNNSRLQIATTPVPAALRTTEGIDALTLLETEWPNVSGAFHQAHRTPELQHQIPELVLALFGFFDTQAKWTEMRLLYSVARDLADRPGTDRRLVAWLEHDLAIPNAERGALEQSLRHLRVSQEMFRVNGDLAGQARCASSLSHVLERLGRLDEAVERAEEALRLSQEIGDQTVEGISYVALANLYNRAGQTVRAERAFNRAIALATMSGNLRSVARRNQIAAKSYQNGGLPEPAIEFMSKALSTFQEIQDRNGQSECHRELAALHSATGDLATALEHARVGAQLGRELGSRQREGEALIELGRVEHALGELFAARDHWRKAAGLLHSQSADQEAIALALLAEHPDPREAETSPPLAVPVEGS